MISKLRNFKISGKPMRKNCSISTHFYYFSVNITPLLYSANFRMACTGIIPIPAGGYYKSDLGAQNLKMGYQNMKEKTSVDAKYDSIKLLNLFLLGCMFTLLYAK